MKKARPASRDVVDVPADNPAGTMDRFTEGLRRVLATPKPHVKRRTLPNGTFGRNAGHIQRFLRADGL